MSIQSRTQAFQLGHGGHGVLLIHGFCGSAAQMRFLAEGLHKSGFTVCVPLLPGHGTNVRDMRCATFRDWHAAMRSAYTALRSECETVTVAGHSMGGVLALLLAEEYPVDGVVALSAPMRLTGFRRLLAPFSPLAAPVVPYITWPGHRKYPKDFLLEDHLCYETLPVASVGHLSKLIRRARRNLFAIAAPVLVIQSSDDPAVSASSPRMILTGVSSGVRERVRLTHSGHMIPLGPERNETLAAMIDFMRRTGKNSSQASSGPLP